MGRPRFELKQPGFRTHALSNCTAFLITEQKLNVTVVIAEYLSNSHQSAGVSKSDAHKRTDAVPGTV